MWLCLFVGIVAASFAATGSAGTISGARTLVNKVMAYELSGKADISRPAFRAFLSTPLRAAFLADDAATPPGEVGNLDYDPICQCQDDGGLTMRLVSLHGDNTAAIAVIENNFTNGQRTRIFLHLARTRFGWRVSDIGTIRHPSLLQDLAAARTRR